MPILKQIEEDIATVSTIKEIVQAYQKIANIRMNTIREKVFKNRKFFIELSAIYQRTKTAYLYSLKRGWIKEQKLSFLQPEKDRVGIFLSANKTFYGPLILDITREIQRFSEKNKLDLAVTGTIGKNLINQSRLNTKTFYFNLEDEEPSSENISKIIEFVKDYKEIIVFHGQYKTVLAQKTVISQISGGLPASKRAPEIKTYLFEPSAEEILRFFEKEIIATLFNQTILEHQLARYASRMIAMYQATENAKEAKKKLLLDKIKLQRQNTNKKQIELFGSLASKL